MQYGQNDGVEFLGETKKEKPSLVRLSYNPSLVQTQGSATRDTSRIATIEKTGPTPEISKKRQIELKMALFAAINMNFQNIDDLADIIEDDLKSGIKIQESKCKDLIKNVLGMM